MSLAKEFTKGFVKENPVFRLVLGLCPVLAVTTSLDAMVRTPLVTFVSAIKLLSYWLWL